MPQTRPDLPRFAPPPGYFGTDRPEVLAVLPSGIEHLLEVGCGAGAFLRAVRAARPGCRVQGIEPDAEAAAKAREQGLDVVTAGFPAGLDAVTGPVDAMVFNDVLEHLVDPWDAVRVAHDRLPPGGWLVASLPNLRNLATLRELVVDGDFPYRASGVLDVTHLRFFTRASVSQLVEEAGFAVRSVTPIGPVQGRAERVVGATVGRVWPWIRREGLWKQMVLVAQKRR